MNRLLLLTVAAVITISAVAQQTGSEGIRSSRNPPLVRSHATPPEGTLPAATQPGANASDGPSQPMTEMLPEAKTLPSADPVLEPGELPKEDMSLIGGTAVKVNKIRDEVEIQPFGVGKKIDVRFDDRSHIFRDGRETTEMSINRGDRIYVDTMLVGGHVFARNLRIVTGLGSVESQGQLTSFDSKSGRANMRDNLTDRLVSFVMTQQTAMNRRGSPASPADLKPGALLDVLFTTGRDGGTADQISVLATPGEEFIFAGRVTNLDLSRGVLNVDNESDRKNYEVHFNTATLNDRNALRVGTEITARARFDGRTYHANQVTVMRRTSAEQ